MQKVFRKWKRQRLTSRQLQASCEALVYIGSVDGAACTTDIKDGEPGERKLNAIDEETDIIRMNPNRIVVYELSIYNKEETNNHHGARKSHHIFTDAVAW